MSAVPPYTRVARSPRKSLIKRAFVVCSVVALAWLGIEQVAGWWAEQQLADRVDDLCHCPTASCATYTLAEIDAWRREHGTRWPVYERLSGKLERCTAMFSP